MLYKFLPWGEAYSLLKVWWFLIGVWVLKCNFFDFCTLKLHFKNRVAKALERVRKVCYNEHPRGRVNCCFVVLIWGEMWLAKVARRGEISNAISKNFVGYCVGCEELWCVWGKWFLRKRKGWKPLQVLGFQPLLSSDKIRYFLLKS